MKMMITYNNGFGKVTVTKGEDGNYYITRSAYLRAWQKVTNPKTGFGGRAALVFDNGIEVIQTKG